MDATDPAQLHPDRRSSLVMAVREALDQVNGVVLGKPETVQLCFCGLLAGGHVLMEDLPGVGKTTLAHALAQTLGIHFGRVQFTSDLLPADVLGVSVYSQQQDGFRFQPGPVFNQMLLTDEINRAPPRTQSALLEAMAEGHVTIDGERHELPRPFFVIATQNPVDMAGTWPLPDSQLDRFLLRLSLGYPDRAAERRLLEESDRQVLLGELQPVLDARSINDLMGQCNSLHVSAALLEYVQDLVIASREHPRIRVGLSPRAALALLRCARAHALLAGREYCLPEDVKAVFEALAGHRLQSTETDLDGRQLARDLLQQVNVP